MNPLVALKTLRVPSALCCESRTLTLRFGRARRGWRFVYITGADHFVACNGRLAEGQFTCLFTH